jgi:integrase/recombinase XerD
MKGKRVAIATYSETRRFGPFTTLRIQQIVQGYREKAGMSQPNHPHLFRHQMLTYLTTKGLSDAQIQLISGHESKTSLACIAG